MLQLDFGQALQRPIDTAPFFRWEINCHWVLRWISVEKSSARKILTASSAVSSTSWAIGREGPARTGLSLKVLSESYIIGA
jgi:hypothetical protein